MTKPIVWIVDENQQQLETHQVVLGRAMTDMDVRSLAATAHQSGIFEALKCNDTACLLLDQRLKETGVATYTGIELAKFVNTINSQLPVFILTNFPDEWQDFEEDSTFVEDILDKSDVRPSTTGLSRLVSKIRRRIHVYTRARDQREERRSDLIKKSYSEPLTSDESNELAVYEAERDRVSTLVELGRIASFEKLSMAHEEAMKKVEKVRGGT